MSPRLSLAVPLLASLLLFAPWSRAGGDHDHASGPTAPAGSALPRFTAASENYELVGVLDGRRLTLYLDRAVDNAPVTDAQIELEVGGVKVKAAKHGVDEFEATLEAVPKPGSLPVTAMVNVGSDADLLAGELDIHEQAHAEAAPHKHSLREYATWAGIAALVLAAFVFVGQRVRAARRAPAGGAA